MNIGVFCSASNVDGTYVHAAKQFAALIASNQHTLVWGGSDTGMMKVVASAVQDGGGKIVGVSVEMLRELARKNADEMIVTKDLGERKKVLLERSDALVVLTGGIGTLDEVTEIIEMKKHHMHNKPIVFLNTNSFYEGLKLQLERMDRDGFFPRPLSEMVYFATTPEEAMRYITQYEN